MMARQDDEMTFSKKEKNDLENDNLYILLEWFQELYQTDVKTWETMENFIDQLTDQSVHLFKLFNIS